MVVVVPCCCCLLILLHIHGCNEQFWSIELQMGMHKKLQAKMLQLHWQNLAKRRAKCSNNGKQRRQRKWPTGESERERESKLDKKGSQPAKCVDYQIYKMYVCTCICVCLLMYAKICISKCSPGTSLLLLNRCWALHAYAPWCVPAETRSWRCRNTSCYELNRKVLLLLLLLVLCIMREIKMFA